MTRILTIIAILIASPVWAEYERPSYNVVLKEDGLEIRDDASAVVVETQVLASRRPAAGEAFRSLFNYISGNNAASLEIPMTSPVTQTPVGKGPDNVSDNWQRWQ